MNYALWLAHGIGHGKALAMPATLADVERRAKFLDEIDDLLITGSDPASQARSLGRRLRYLATASADEMRDVPDPLDRIAIALRLWAGCLSAAKTLAAETRSGANSTDERESLFP